MTMNEITKSLVKATLDKYPDLDDEIWAKLHYMVNDQCVGKSVVRNSSVVIDSSNNCTRKQIGLRSFGNRRLTTTTQLALDQFDQGLTMERDREGNIYFRNNSDAASRKQVEVEVESCHVVEVMGWREPHMHSLSSAIVIEEGRIPAQSIKVFDMCEYKSHVALELQRQTVDHDRLHQLSIFCISIGNSPAAAAAAAATTTTDKTNVEDAMPPSNWLCIINLSAIDGLTNEKVISDIKAMQHLDLIRLPDAQLRRNWSRQESQQRPEFEDAEEGGEGGKKAEREKHRKLRKTKSDSGRSYSWMTEEEKIDNRPTRRMFTGHSKRESFPGERKEWSALIEL